MRLPIRVRLTLWYLGVLCLSFAILGCSIFLAVRASINRIIDADLSARLAATRTFMTQHIPSDAPAELQDEFQEYSASAPGGELLQISDESGAWVYQSLSIQKYGIPTPVIAAETSQQFSSRRHGDSPLRIITQTVMVGSKPYIVQLVTDITKFALVLERLRWLLLVSTPLAIGLALAGGYWLSGRALKPVRRIAETARSVGAHRLSQRLDVPKTGDELEFLAETLNAMLARIESSFERIAQFTADASHELRTPLAIIQTTAEIALRRQRDEIAYRKSLEDILDEACRTNVLIEDLLTLARSDSATQQLVLCPMDVIKAVEAACSKTKLLASQKGIALSLSIRQRDIWIEGDEWGLDRLFLILFDNAIKYTPTGGKVSAVLEMNDHLPVFQIQDSGIGISPQDMPHIFERFYRADKARSRKHDGFGLGLAIAKRIADAHEADIEVDSVEGQGSIFRICFSSCSEKPQK